MTNQASEELRKSVEQCFIKNNMCDCGGEHNALNIDETEYFDVESVVDDVISLIRTEKLNLLAEVRERVVGEDEKLVIPDYPNTDDEGEPLYSKRAAKEGRKQVTARYHTRKELRNDQRIKLTKLEAEL